MRLLQSNANKKKLGVEFVRSRRAISNEGLMAEIDADTAENGPFKVGSEKRMSRVQWVMNEARNKLSQSLLRRTRMTQGKKSYEILIYEMFS